MADDRAYEELTVEQKILVNDRIIEGFKNPDQLAIFNAAMKDAQGNTEKYPATNGLSNPQDVAFQRVLDAQRDELAEAIVAGKGGFPKYENTPLASNGVDEKQDLAKSSQILQAIRDQLQYKPELNRLQFTSENMGTVISNLRGDTFPFAGQLPHVEGLSGSIEYAQSEHVIPPSVPQMNPGREVS